MILRSLILALALAATPALAQTVTVNPDGGLVTTGMAALDTHVTGRTLSGSWEDLGTHVTGPSWTHQWPGVYFDAAFDGPEVVLRFEDPYNHYDLIVDGKTLQRIDKPGSADVKVSGLGDGEHTIRLLKTSESQSSAGSFNGFFVPEDRGLLAPDASPRQIEFIGDSWTVGYGNTSDKRQCTPDELWSTTDTGQAFGPRVAAFFKADYEVNAYSGRGIVRNYDGVAAGAPLPFLYPYTLFDHESPKADDETWQPQVIVVGLGGNDFSTPLHPDEKWPDQDALRADYISSYVAFVQGLRTHNPNARFILLDYAEGEISNDVAAAAAKLQDAGDSGVDVVTVHGFEQTGCDWHLSLKDDQKIADALIKAIDARADIWGGQ